MYRLLIIWVAVSQECGSERGRADQFCVHTHAHTHGATRTAERFNVGSQLSRDV